MSDLQAFLEDGWARHDSETAAVADALEANVGLLSDDASVVPYLLLANHTIGEHGGDWGRAAGLDRRVLADRADTADLSLALGSAAAAHVLAGDAIAGAQFEARAMAVAPLPIAANVRIKALIVGALAARGDLEAAVALYQPLLEIARQLSDGGADRPLAIASNNLASDLLEQSNRSAAGGQLMVIAAEAAHEFWCKVGTWINEARAEYLLVCVHNALQNYADALTHAERAAALFTPHPNEELVDLAFILLEQAKAERGLNRSDQASTLARADQLAAAFEGGLLQSYENDRATIFGARAG